MPELYPTMLGYTQSSFLTTVSRREPIGPIAPAAQWTEEFLDWRTQQNRTRPRQTQPSAGWTWLEPHIAHTAIRLRDNVLISC